MDGPLPCLFSSVKDQRAAPEFNWKCSCHATRLHPRLAFGVEGGVLSAVCHILCREIGSIRE